MLISFWPLHAYQLGTDHKVKRNCIIPCLQKHSSSFFNCQIGQKPGQKIQWQALNSETPMPFSWVQGMPLHVQLNGVNCSKCTLAVKQKQSLSLMVHIQAAEQAQSSERSSMGERVFLQWEWECPKVYLQNVRGHFLLYFYNVHAQDKHYFHQSSSISIHLG